MGYVGEKFTLHPPRALHRLRHSIERSTQRSNFIGAADADTS